MSVGAYWARNLAPGDTRWQELSQPVTEGVPASCQVRGQFPRL